jgi:small conductance mechanosensitive channel
MIDFEVLSQKMTQLFSTYGLKIISAIFVIVLGRIIIRLISRMVARSMAKTKTDKTLVGFVENLTYMLGMVFVIIAALGILDIPTASLVAVLGAAGLAIGLAFQGALSNFAAGFLIIAFRPFNVGDLIEAAGSLGIVRKIELFTTTLTTLDNKTVIIPNSALTGDKIVNYTETDTLRVDLIFGTSYSDDIDHVKKVITSVIESDKRILTEPAPLVAVTGHNDSSIDYAVRPWVKAEDYWGVYFDMHEKVKKAFDANGISIPFPQREVRLLNKES